MKFRFVWVPCPDCGRRGTNGGCYEVEQRFLFWWTTALVTFDRGGCRQPEHYPTEQAALADLQKALQPRQGPTVTKEFSL